MPDETELEPADDGQEDLEPLSKIERIGAAATGVVCLGAGGASVFATTNQAGSVALLGVGAAFLTVAINGAPLLGAKFKDYEVRMGRRRKRVARQAELAGPEEGQRKLQILEQLDPAAREDPAVIDAHVRLYRQEVETAVVRALSMASIPGVQVLDRVPHGPSRTDMQVQGPELTVDVELIYAQSDWILGDHSLRFSFQSALQSGVPRVLITNMRIPNSVADIAEAYDPKHTNVQVVRWRDIQDDMALALALHRLGIAMSRWAVG